MKRSALVLLSSSYVVQSFETFAIPSGPKLNLRATRLFTRKLKAYPADYCVIENNDHMRWYRPLFHALLTACQIHNIATLDATPSAIRKALVGKGNATKEYIAAWLNSEHEILFEEDPGLDLSDAAACAAWGVAHLAKRGTK